MQIKMFTDNNINVTIGRAAQQKRQHMQSQNGPFDGPQCRVTISKEGRKLSEQSDRRAQKSEHVLRTQRMAEMEQIDEALSETTKSEYLDLMEEIDNIIKSMKNSKVAGEDLETLQRKQDVLGSIRDQKMKQQEENQKRAKEAQQMAMQSSEMQDEIDKGNRDLLVMLKSIEEAEEAEEEREGKTSEGDGSSDSNQENSVSDTIADSATRFATSSMKRELDVVGLIHELQEEGLQYLAKADDIENKMRDEAKSLKEFLNDENISDEEKKEAVFSYGLKMAPKASAELEILLGANYTKKDKEEALERYRSMAVKDSDLANYKRRGQQMLIDAKECNEEHIKANPLQGMEETRDSMIQSAVDAAFNEASQGKLDETSQELEDEVKDLIDERNDIDHVDSEEEKNEEEEKEIGELLNPKEDPEEVNNNSETDEEVKLEDRIVITQG